jgi:aryl-alcohol dehydrogenase-like predicted oxidoreductase
VRTRPLGQTGIDVSELSLGTWGLAGDGYGAVVEAEKDRTIDRALELGVTLFDTADVYGKGAMERKLGERLPKDGTRVVTKLGTDLDATPPRKRFTASYLQDAFERSRERLKRGKLDIVLLHNPTMEAMGLGEGASVLKELKESGRIAAWGVSAGSVEVARSAIMVGAEVIELAYNVFVARDLHELAADLSESGTAVLARSVLAHGLLTGHWSSEREFYEGDHRTDRWTREELKRRIAQLDALRPLVSTGQVPTLRAASLRFALANQLVSSVVLGPRSVTQLEQLAREAGSGPPYLRDTALADLSSRLRALGLLD